MCRGSLRNTLTDLPKIILTAHNPEPLGSEHFENKMSQGYDYDIAKQVKEEWLKIEELGFMLADILIFPSPEAMDPARHFLNNFNFIEKSKDIRFLKTGCMPIAEGPGRASILEQYNIPPDAKVIGFLGRHTYIKGYDILKEACTNLLEKHKNLYVLIAGNGVIPPLQHPRWIECGRVDPKNFLEALDLFILPNRTTYYDLVSLEVMSKGIPILASRTGGNISLARDVPAFKCFEPNVPSLIEGVDSFFNLPEVTRKSISKDLLNFYHSDFSLEAFGKRYIQTIEQIYKDYGF